MSNIAIQSKNQLAKALSKFSTYTILVWPIRLLIIISAVLIPVLLGLIIYFYYKHQNQIDDVLKQARTIEGMIVNNIEKGIDYIKSKLGGDITEDSIIRFIDHNLKEPLTKLIANYYNQANDKIKTITINAEDLNNIEISFDGKKYEIKNLETLIKTKLSVLLNDVIPQFVDGMKDVIKKQIGDNPKEFDEKMKEFEDLLKLFSNDPNNTIGYLMAQFSLFFNL